MNAKKLLLGTLGLVASLGMSANSLAYYGETTAPDFPSGFYIGLQGGYAHTYWKDLDGISNLSPVMLPINFDGGTGSYAGRIYVGYDFNEFLHSN